MSAWPWRRQRLEFGHFVNDPYRLPASDVAKTMSELRS